MQILLVFVFLIICAGVVRGQGLRWRWEASSFPPRLCVKVESQRLAEVPRGSSRGWLC